MDFEVIKENGLFHPKIGILEDIEGNKIAFSGSVNETAQGWLNNHEVINVYRSWIEVEKDYYMEDFNLFNEYWNGNESNYKVMDLPTAVKKRFIDTSPEKIEELRIYEVEEQIIKSKIKNGRKKEENKLREYQIEAINNWIEKNNHGIFEMATGTGKTIAALGCLNELNSKVNNSISIISCPQVHLVQQWEEEIKKLNLTYDLLLLACGANYNWKDLLSDALDNNYLGFENKIIIITTHDTLSSKDFINIINEKAKSENLLLIADEVHGLGSIKRRKGLLEKYNYRLGLSATPKRYFDTIGTEILYQYFGQVVYEFPLSQALITINPDTNETFLTPYRYLPIFTDLNEFELEEYIDLTNRIITQYNKSKNNDEEEEKLERLLFARSNIIKDAENKIELLKDLLKKLGTDIKWTIIYCTPKQINKVIELINNLGIKAHRFTMSEGITPNKKFDGLSERKYLLKKFAEGKYQILIAMKCLDEGVDIPPARTAIIMASSGNPREYIQRIGRVVRRYLDKKEAVIYDFLVVPNRNKLSEEAKKIENKIFEKEYQRFIEIAQTSINSVSAVQLINNYYYKKS